MIVKLKIWCEFREISNHINTIAPQEAVFLMNSPVVTPASNFDHHGLRHIIDVIQRIQHSNSYTQPSNDNSSGHHT